MRPLALVFLLALGCHRSAPAPAAEVEAAAPTPKSAGPFSEGEIELEVGGVYSFTVSMKGDKNRIETSKGGVAIMGPMIADGTMFFALDASRKQALVVDTKLLTKSALVPVDTGRTDTVLGHSCAIVEVTEGAAKKTLCVARDFPMLRTNIGVTPGGTDWVPDFAIDGKGFPLRIVVTNAAGVVVGKGEAVRIDAKPIADARFEVPADYTHLPAK